MTIKNATEYLRKKNQLTNLKSEVSEFEKKVAGMSASKRKRIMGQAKFQPSKEIGIGRRYARMWRDLKDIVTNRGAYIWNSSRKDVLRLLGEIEKNYSKPRFSRPTILENNRDD